MCMMTGEKKMKFTKEQTIKADKPYAAAVLPVGGKQAVFTAAEGEGPVLLIDPPDFTGRVIADGPGGCMGFTPFPGRDDAVFMSTGLFPVFKGETGGIHLLRQGSAGNWHNMRIADLPFVHRIASVTAEDNAYLLAATVCGGKENRDDWSRPGTVYAAKIPADPDDEWQFVPILEGIRKNHGMAYGNVNGSPCILICGAEGLFALFPPAASGDDWRSSRLLENEISEAVQIDLDGDGEDEIVTIEPFHGDKLRIYKKEQDDYGIVFETAFAFGHGLWAGNLGNRPSIIAANRAESKNLMCYTMQEGSAAASQGGGHAFTDKITEHIIDAGSGTANADCLHLPDGPRVITANPERAEYAVYKVEL